MNNASTNAAAATPAPRRRRRLLRRLFRWLAVACLLLLLLLGFAGWWLSHVGLPDRAKQQLLAQLRNAGWAVEFSRLRWTWHRGIVAEDLQLSRTNATGGPQIFIQSAQCKLNHAALKSLHLQVEAVRLTGGQFIYEAAGPPRRAPWRINNVDGELLFKSDNLWELSGLRANLQGIKLQLTGTLTNAALVREWKLPRPPKRGPETAPAAWRRLLDAVQEFQFEQPPEVIGQFRVDAQDLENSQADLHMTVPSFSSRWGSGDGLLLSARLTPPANPEAEMRVEIDLSAERVRTTWGEARSFRFRSVLEPTLARWLPTNSATRIELQDLKAPWARAAELVLTHTLSPCPTNQTYAETKLAVDARELRCAAGEADFTRLAATLSHPATNWAPAVFAGDVHFENLRSQLGRARNADVQLNGSLPSRDQLSLFATNLAWPDRLARVALDATGAFREIQTLDLNLPRLDVTNHLRQNEWQWGIAGPLGQGQLGARGILNLPTRELTFQADSTIDPLPLAPWIGTNAQRVLNECVWLDPPRLQLEGQLTLPAWTNRQPDWAVDVLPSLRAQGRLQSGPCAFRDVSLDGLELSFLWTNLALQMPALVLTRPEGKIEAALAANYRTKDFSCRWQSSILPETFRPLLQKDSQRRVLDFAEFTTPPVITAQIQGRWDDLTSLAATGEIAASDFKLRGEEVGLCRAGISFTNRLVQFINPVVERPKQRGTAPLLTLDLARQELLLTNVSGNLDPYVVTRIIGPKTARAITPYRFDVPPEVFLDGVVDLNKKTHQDRLHFRVGGGPFHWGPFHLQAIHGEVDVNGKAVVLTNVVGSLHGGEVRGHAHFESSPANRTDFAFDLNAAQIDLHNLMQDLNPRAKTNRLEGVLGGSLRVIYANTLDPKSWQGEGTVQLRDGLIWDIPVFGVFSPVLDAFVPGLGHSRAREGTATFTITNSVISSKDLQIRASGMRMQFAGTVDFEPRVNARVEAELLRDLPGIGFFVSKLFWPVTKLFEYKLTGALGDPKIEPVYLIPKIILMPFHPFRTFKDLLTPGLPEPAPQSAPAP